MSRIFVTGSADGLGLEAARQLISQGHNVFVHGRNEERAAAALAAATGASAALAGDLSSVAQTRELAERANEIGRFDAVIHNAGVGYGERRQITGDGVEHVFAVNVLAPYVLTAAMAGPARLVYLTSGLHRQGSPDLPDINWERRRWNGMQAYADSKLYDAALAFAVARLWRGVFSNAVDPGWVRTRMGGPGAPGGLAEGAATQVWLAAGEDPATVVSARLFHHCRVQEPHPFACDSGLQDDLLRVCGALSGIYMPTS